MRIVLLCPLLLLLCASCSPQGSPDTDHPDSPKQVQTNSGLAYEVVSEGSGPVAKPGQTVRIHETLTLPNGKLLFSSRTKGEPVTFLLGGNQVIAGVDEGVTGMRVGERRKLIVPQTLDGRTFDPEFIPPESSRHYDIELVEIVE